MKKYFTMIALAVVCSFASQQQASAGNFRFSMGFNMEFGHGNGYGRHGHSHSPYYLVFPYPPTPIVVYGHAAPVYPATSGQQNWTAPAPAQTPANGVGWTQPYQPYGNVYRPAYWYGW